MPCVAHCIDSRSLPFYAGLLLGDIENEGELLGILVTWETAVLCHNKGTADLVSESHCEM